MSKNPDVVVIGAGAAGIVAAMQAAKIGARVTVLEKTPRLGTKILISGGGKCNITHDGSIEHVLKAFRPNEARFLRPSCYKFTNKQIVELLTRRGMNVYTRPDGRIFPVDQTAKDVVAILENYLYESGGTVLKETPAIKISHSEGRITGVITNRGEIPCSQVIVSVGGSSYSNSGTTGDGWPWAEEMGHKLVRRLAALAPLYLKLDWESPSGVALRDCVLKARLNGKEIDRWKGDLLFTHQGLSGPCALGISRVVSENFSNGSVQCEVDITPEKTFEELQADLNQYAERSPKKQLISFTESFMPERIAELIHHISGIDPISPCQRVGKKDRNRLIEHIKMMPLGSVRVVPLEKGEVVAGGVSLDEVDPQTLESLKMKGLYLCGEVLDIAGPVGGYNLQAAWSTGYVAGETAANTAIAGRKNIR